MVAGQGGEERGGEGVDELRKVEWKGCIDRRLFACIEGNSFFRLSPFPIHTNVGRRPRWKFSRRSWPVSRLTSRGSLQAGRWSTRKPQLGAV